jgi:outer membrane protein assembly factor BamA
VNTLKKHAAFAMAVLAAMLLSWPFPLKAVPQAQADSKIVVADLRIGGNVNDVDIVRARILKGLEGREFDRDSRWLDQIVAAVRGDFEVRGYIRADVEPLAMQPLDFEQHHMLAIVHVGQGDQYRVAGITVLNEDSAHALLIPEEQLRQQFQLRPGDVFDTSKLRAGINGMQRLYGALGYADMTATPAVDFDNKNHSVSLKMEVHEGNQYHVESLEVVGLDSETKQLLEAKMPPGSIFNFIVLRELFDQGKAVVGGNITFDHVVRLTKNVGAATVDISLDFSGEVPHVN